MFNDARPLGGQMPGSVLTDAKLSRFSTAWLCTYDGDFDIPQMF